jgi:HD-GYP domain-containing protein (c-di-GMP phosphodiesterase class II)
LKLVPFKSDYLRLDETLPFGLRDGTGRLILAAGHKISNSDRMDELRQQPLFADESESSQWFRRLAAAVDERFRQGAELREVAQARPDETAREASVARTLTLTEDWTEIVSRLDAVLRDVRPDSDWRPRLMAIHLRARQLAQKRGDASLYHLIYEAAHSTRKYSSRHALLCLTISELVASLLQWQAEWVDSLGRAALLMNVSMLRLQDQLAGDDRPLKAEIKAEIQDHPARSARLLQDCGFADTLCMDVVRLHHEEGPADVPLADLDPARQLARLLRRVDIFAAQISLRASRPPVSPVTAARQACLAASGVPDEIGGALLRAVGLYPPGSFVELASGEIGIVVARGRRANLPQVAALLSHSGSLIAEPLLRDTMDRRFAAKSAVAPSRVRVIPPHERLLALR